jgi:hypothetical protein
VSFHLITLQLGDEEELMERAEIALAEVEEGETAFLPEYLAWTAGGSGRAFARLLHVARERRINIVTSLNLGADLIEDLPGHLPEQRYNALAVFTRHGVVHVPQAKISTQSFEMDPRLDGPGIAVSPYSRLNRVRLDVDEELLDVYFLICSDLHVFQHFTPAELACDLLVVIGNFADGAERNASRLLGHALEAGVARTALHVNAFHVPTKPGRPPLAREVEEVLDATTKQKKPLDAWPNPRAMRAGFYVYDDGAADDFVSMCNLPKRRGRIAVPASRWDAPVERGIYPVTIVL